MVINFYNSNFQLFITTKFLFENMQDYFIGFTDLEVFDLNPIEDIYLLLAIVFSFCVFICLIISLLLKVEKKPEVENDNNTKVVVIKKKNLSKKLKEIFCFVCNLFRKNFRSPTFYEVISKYLNINQPFWTSFSFGDHVYIEINTKTIYHPTWFLTFQVISVTYLSIITGSRISHISIVEYYCYSFSLWSLIFLIG